MRLSCCVTLALLAACATDGSEAAERQADTTARRDSIAAVSAGSMTEANVIAFLTLVHSADSVVGLLGAQKGSTLEIKDFGRMILREHTALGRDITKLAEKAALMPQAPSVAPEEPPAAMRDNIVAGAPGPAWDRSYIDYAIAAHSSAIENTARALAATRRPDIKEFIEKSVPILQKHLDKAKALQKRAARQS
jgi:putative membrane protein